VISRPPVASPKDVRSTSVEIKKETFSMKSLFWNSERLSDLAKFKYIYDVVKDHNLDFIAVMETVKLDMFKTNLTRFSGDTDIVWHCLPPRGRSGYNARY
jgi:glycerol-3-phosphate cytidylyltransferase-like family protein